MRNPLSMFKDRVRRPRAIIWTAVIVIGFAFLFASSQVATSTRWFCNDVCHVVHQDNAAEYYMGSHSKVNCVACHYPPSMNPVSFTLDRVDKLLDIYPTIAGTYEWPVNRWSRMALATADEQCTQCHALDTRPVNASRGMIMDHEVHAGADVNCAACHNRVAHPEDNYELQLEGNVKKQDFMTMTACYRCHWLGEDRPSEYVAPGECTACHKESFDLVPASHDTTSWYNDRGISNGHADAAHEALDSAEEHSKEWEAEKEEFYSKEPRFFAKLAGVTDELQVDVPPANTIFECRTCHLDTFCTDCHGTQIPHEAEFKDKHSEEYKTSDAASCGKCHNKSGSAKYDSQSCTMCHHPAYKPQDGTPWELQHPAAARGGIEEKCYPCHEEVFCSSCHVRGEPVTPY